jgi:hypothetical protein
MRVFAAANLLPSASTMSRTVVASTEAAANQWSGEDNADGTVSVNMCLQCQITRSVRHEGKR